MNAALVRHLVVEAFKRSYLEGEDGAPVSDSEIYVTEVSGCLRRSFFIRRQPIPLPENLYVVFEIGKGLHYIIQRFLPVEACFEVPCELDLGDFRLKGRADVVLDDVILELKSIARIREDWIPYPNHILQLQAYLWMLDRPRGFIVYIEKSRGRIYPIEVEREASAWALIIQRARVLHHHLLNNEPPRPEPSSLCKICDYRRICHEGEGQGFQ